MTISIIGAGNVATQLALTFKKAGHQIIQVYNRTEEHGLQLAETVGASFTSDIENLQPADVYIIAVKDDAITELANWLIKVDGIVAHTSGTQPMHLLAKSNAGYGIFYPLQTMTVHSVLNFKLIPILVDGSDDKTKNTLQTLAKSISEHVHLITDEQRQWIHVAAVMVNNFTNHLYTLGNELLNQHNISFDVLKPLILQTAQNAVNNPPFSQQTGPAVRNDISTIQKHLQLLDTHPDMQLIYKAITENIRLKHDKSS